MQRICTFAVLFGRAARINHYNPAFALSSSSQFFAYRRKFRVFKMEVVGSVAATLQLAQAMGVTLLKVREAYSQIMDIDDFLHDFDGQLDVTRTTIAILQDGIGNGEFDASTKDWWRQSDLERLLRSCHQHYQRLNDIFIKIARQRSSATALRAWIRTKRYDSDISHLRLCINTCTNALQLLVTIHKM